MEETISDLDLKLEWSRMGDNLKVTHKGTVVFSVTASKSSHGLTVYSSITGKASPLLSERQVKWIYEHFTRKKKNYVFS